jgi:hypothetical protein
MAIMLDIITFAVGIGLIFVAIGHDAGGPLECTSANGLCKTTADTTALGTWRNFPSASRCSSGNYSSASCELMGNTSQRGILYQRSTISAAGLSVDLSVGCVTPSNTVGAILQLQYANFSQATNTNTSNFVNIAGTIKIDNSVFWSCPGMLIAASAGSLPNIQGLRVPYQFRVVGSGGGGVGDNPRFNSVNVIVHQIISRVVYFVTSSVTTTSFVTTASLLTQPTSVPLVMTFDWVALNTTTLHGTTTCSIVVLTASSCSVTTTFSSAFAGTPSVLVSADAPGAGLMTLTIASISLLREETVTV